MILSAEYTKSSRERRKVLNTCCQTENICDGEYVHRSISVPMRFPQLLPGNLVLLSVLLRKEKKTMLIKLSAQVIINRCQFLLQLTTFQTDESRHILLGVFLLTTVLESVIVQAVGSSNYQNTKHYPNLYSQTKCSHFHLTGKNRQLHSENNSSYLL